MYKVVLNRQEQRNNQMSTLQVPRLSFGSGKQKSPVMSLVSRFHRRRNLRRIFRRKVNIMIYIFKCYFESRRKLRKIYWPLDEVKVVGQNDEPEIHLENLDSFRKRQFGVKFSLRGKKILHLPVQERTPEMIEQLRALMQSIVMFARWPVYVQREFCKIAWYDCFDKNRVLIRKGFRSDCLFFVLSGRLTCDRGEDDRLSYMQQRLEGKAFFNIHEIYFDGENRDQIRFGESFGLEDIYYSQQRSATVFTNEDVELFVVHIKDYRNIFRNFLKRSDKILDVCRQVYALSDWPVDVLYRDPHSWIMQNFTKGSVICSNCAESQWIYIVINGKCKVIKYLTLAELERFNEVSRERRAMENRKSLSKFFGEKTPSHSRSRSTSVYKMPDNTPTKLTMTWNHEIWDDEDDWYVRHAARQGMEPLPLVEKSKLPKSTTCRHNVAFAPETDNTVVTLPKMNILLKKCTTSRSLKKTHQSRILSASSSSSSLSFSTIRRHGSISSSSKSSNARQDTYKCLPTYIELKTLRTREAFGIEPIIYAADKEFTESISLISDGAECILIPRRIFKEHLSLTKVGIMQIKVERFPDCKRLIESLMNSMQWKNYKGSVVTDIMKRIDDKREFIRPFHLSSR